jgi:hypothetical protein
MDKGKQGNGLLIVAGALFAIGSFLDWATLGPIGATGMDGGDGWFTLIAGGVMIVVGFLAFQGSSTEIPPWVAWVAWAVGTLITVINLFDILGEEFADLSLGIGMYMLLAAVVLGIIGLVFLRQSDDSAGGMAPPPPPSMDM